MDKFIIFWTATRPDLYYFFVCDILTAHKDFDVVEKARNNGVYFIKIMPGYSHWFQVHDQEPFGILKKTISDEKKKIHLLPPQHNQELGKQ